MKTGKATEGAVEKKMARTLERKLEPERFLAEYPHMKPWVRTIPDSVAAACTLGQYPRGSVLFSRGDEIRNVFLICSGTVMISTSNLTGCEKRVVFSGQGQIVGEMEALLHHRDLIYGAKAYTDCLLLVIPLAGFAHWVETDETVCRCLMYALAGKLLNSSESTVQYQNLTARLRLSNLLAHQKPGVVRETRLALAEVCGVSERTVYRVLEEMAQSGEVSLHGRKILLSQAQINYFLKVESQNAKELDV